MVLFGHDFQAGWLLLVLTVLGQLINCGTGSVGYLLLMSGNQRHLMRVQAVMGGLLLLADLIFVPRSGILAAAIVAALGTAVTNLVYLVAVRRMLHLFPYNHGYLRLLGPAMTSAIAIWATKLAPVNNLAGTLFEITGALVLGYTVFLAGSLAFGLDDDDRAIVQAVRVRLSTLLPARARVVT